VRIIRSAFWVAGLVLLAASLVFFVHLSSSNREFSGDNTGWNGTSRFFSDLDRHRVEHIAGPAQLSLSWRNATLLIIAPSRIPTGPEISAYRSFLDAGNTIIIADDFGTANAILTGIGSTISVLPGNLSSVDREYADFSSVVAYRAADGGPVENVYSILLNRPAALAGGTPLMRTSTLSWIDLNGDRRISRNEVLGVSVVMASDPRWEGRLVVLSDPSIFINAMADAGQAHDNRQLIRNLADRGGPLLIDEMNSRTRDAGVLGEILHVIRTTVILKVLVISVLLLILAWVWKRRFSEVI